MQSLTTCKPGKYRIKAIRPWSQRLSEMGFVVDRILYIVANNSLGIRIRIDSAVYLVNKMTAIVIHVEPEEN